MMHSAPRAAALVVPAPLPTAKFSAPFFPKGARPAPRPVRPTFKTRRYETMWLTADGQVDSSTRVAPALPEFEEAFSAIARGTLIATTNGFVAIEDLQPGMVAITTEGRRETITWIGSMTLFPANAIPGVEATTMTRVTADAFGGNCPMPDLLLGPQARILLKNARTRAAGHEAAYASARDMIDGDAIIEVAPVAPMTMFHVVLENHGSLSCAGVGVESFHPGKKIAEKLDPQLAALFITMFPQMKCFSDFGPLAHARMAREEAEGQIAA